MQDQESISEVAKELGVTVTAHNWEKDRQLLAERVNYLLVDEFEKLVSILYRLDVNESKLKEVIHQNPGVDAGLIIADLMIERQSQKIKSRRESRRDNDISEEEKW